MRDFLEAWAVLLLICAGCAVFFGVIFALTYVVDWNPIVGVSALILVGTAFIAAVVTAVD